VAVAPMQSRDHAEFKAWKVDLSEQRRRGHEFLPESEIFRAPVNYEVEGVLGVGGFGIVVGAVDKTTGTATAIKKIGGALRDSKQCRYFLREIVYQSRLIHENILELKDIWLEDGVVYLGTDQMPTDLGWVIKSPQPLSSEHVMWFVFQIARGLKYLHAANIVHRDLKPSNCLVAANCDLKICDFGMCRVIDQGQEQSPRPLSEYVVTRWYRAPEIILCAQYDHRVDSWSLGCILAQLIQRKPLFKGDGSRQTLDNVLAVIGAPSDKYIEAISLRGARNYLQRAATRSEFAQRTVEWNQVLRPSPSYGELDESCIEVLDHLLQFDHSLRARPEDVLESAWMATSACCTRILRASDEDTLLPDKLCPEWEDSVDWSNPTNAAKTFIKEVIEDRQNARRRLSGRLTPKAGGRRPEIEWEVPV